MRTFALSVTDLDMDLIDRINPFGEAYAILAKSMSEERLQAGRGGNRRPSGVNLSLADARDLAKRALRFKQEKGQAALPNGHMIRGKNGWQKGIAFLQRKATEENNG